MVSGRSYLVWKRASEAFKPLIFVDTAISLHCYIYICIRKGVPKFQSDVITLKIIDKICGLIRKDSFGDITFK